MERGGEDLDTSAKGAIMRQINKFNVGHVKNLFATKKLAISTGLLIVLWGMPFHYDTYLSKS